MGILILILVVLLGSPFTAHATRYWVAPGGSDATSCASVDGDADPGVYRATPQGGIACLASGDTLTIKSGTYTGTTATINGMPSGTVVSNTIIEGDPSSAVGCAIAHTCPTIIQRSGPGTTTPSIMYLWDLSYITIRKLDFDGSTQPTIHPLRVGGTSHHILFEDIETREAGDASTGVNGILTEPSTSFITINRMNSHHNGQTTTPLGHGGYFQGDDHLIMNSWFHHNSNLGMQCYNSKTTSGGRADRCTITGNLFEDNTTSGLAMEGYDDVFTRNIVRNNTASGVLAGYGGVDRIKIYNNAIYNNGGASGISLGHINGTALNAEVKNNIIIGHTTEVTIGINVVGSVLSHNACASADSCGTTGKVTIAAFTDCLVSDGNPTQKAGSSCLGFGTNVGLPYNGSGPEVGPEEVPLYSSCEVPNGQPTKVRLRFTNNVNPPMLPASGVTGVTVRKNGASNPVLSFTRIGDNQYDLAMTNSQISTDVVDLSIVAGTTNLTDSALIGGTINQPFLTTLTNTSCTNNLAAGSSHTFTQADYELHDLQGDEAAPTILPYGYASTGAAENFINYKVRPLGRIRVRISMVCGVANCPDSSFYPYVSTGGAYAKVLDDFSVNDIKMVGVLQGLSLPGNGSATTCQLSTGGTCIPGGIVFTSNAIPNIAGLNVGYKTELEYGFELSASASGYFDIRLHLEDGTALTTYTNIPRLMVEPVAAGGL